MSHTRLDPFDQPANGPDERPGANHAGHDHDHTGPDRNSMRAVGIRSTQPSKVRTVSHKIPIASTKTSTAQNVHHPRPLPTAAYASAREETDEDRASHDRAEDRKFSARMPGPKGIDTKIGHDRGDQNKRTDGQCDRPTLTLDPDGQGHADAGDERSVGEDGRDQHDNRDVASGHRSEIIW